MDALAPRFPVDERVVRLRARLDAGGFSGQFEDQLGARHVASTDNSIYQVVPTAIAYPANARDVEILVGAAREDEATPLSLTARGGNTGTNGQSLNDGVIVDFARNMNHIVAIDVEARTVVVEPGVVLNQLNAALEQHGLFFPPNVSTATRATIGGMVATDASGKGSRHYGKTSDYIEALDLVLADGGSWTARAMDREEAEIIALGSDCAAEIHRELLRIVRAWPAEIAATFPKMNRGLTGYNLQKAYDAGTDRLSLPYLLAGSEGTLAITTTITLRVIAKPTHRALAVLRYSSFDAGLRDVTRLLEADPLAIEILDDKVLSVARQDIIWNGMETILGGPAGQPVRAMNFVEFTGFAQAEVEQKLGGLARLQAVAPPDLLDMVPVSNPKIISQLWTLREKSVGLLAKLGSGRQGVAFVEDTAVPPDALADYVAAFRRILDDRGLQYGMFGHADVGCLHVRPFLDMRSRADADLIRPISDKVALLTKSYGGLLWGEHGRGFRGEYSPLFFGPALYPELQRLKRAFDPDNLFNPGKLASPDPDRPVDLIDGVLFRGEQDRRIDPGHLAGFDRSVACNGNGACFSWDAQDVMCPSYRATRDRAQSPKGRAALLRSWAQLSCDTDPGNGSPDMLVEIEEATRASLSTCLSCKACTTLCPVGVDVPAMKSRFLEQYYARRGRPLRHLVLASLEPLLAAGRLLPALTNLVGQALPVRALLPRMLGLVDLPRLSPRIGYDLPVASVVAIERLSAQVRGRSVVLVEDSFTGSFDRSVVMAAASCLLTLGYHVLRLPPRPNGKALHVLGLRDRFRAIAGRRVAELGQIARTGVALIGLDAATSLMTSQEYREFEPNELVIDGMEAFLAREIAGGRAGKPCERLDSLDYALFSHCTEQALRPQAAEQWVAVFAHFGIGLDAVRSGCCGMAGLFGHETEHLSISRRLFELSWGPAVAAGENRALATGYSCRSQTMRMGGFRPRHPVEILASRMQAEAAT